MNNIKSKYYSPQKISKGITRALYAYLIINIVRIMLYIVFRISTDNKFYIQGNELLFDLNEINLYTMVLIIIFCLVTVILIIVSVTQFANCIRTILENGMDTKVGKLFWVYILAMVADILIALGFACVAILLDSFALIMIALSIAEICVFIWLIHVRKNEEEE